MKKDKKLSEIELEQKGRPTKYSDEIADKICNIISTSSRGIHSISKELELAPSTIFKWLSEISQFSDNYARAKLEQAHYMAEEIIKISDNDSNDDIHVDSLSGGYEIPNKEWIARTRVRVDTRKWLMSKLAPKIYGDKIELSGGLNIQNNTITLADGTEVTI